MEGIVQTVALGVLNGAAVGVLGYLAARRSEGGKREEFDFAKFGAALLLGAAVGGFASWRGRDLSDVVNWADSSGYVAIAQMALKAVWRNSPVQLQEAVNALKKGRESGGNPPVSPLPA